jgi:hypothetical protein
MIIHERNKAARVDRDFSPSHRRRSTSLPGSLTIDRAIRPVSEHCMRYSSIHPMAHFEIESVRLEKNGGSDPWCCIDSAPLNSWPSKRKDEYDEQ